MYKRLLLFACSVLASLDSYWTDRVVSAAESAEPIRDAAITGQPMDFDYFTNNWNVVGLKDYKFGRRITPDNELVLTGKTPVEIRIGADRTPLSRENPKLAMDGWMPIILVTAEEGSVRHEVAYWATPLPYVKDWEKAFDWPTEGENFLNWIRVSAVNTSDRPVEASVELGPNSNAKAPSTPEEQRGAQVARVRSRRHAWSWQLSPGGSAEVVIPVLRHRRSEEV